MALPFFTFTAENPELGKACKEVMSEIIQGKTKANLEDISVTIARLKGDGAELKAVQAGFLFGGFAARKFVGSAVHDHAKKADHVHQEMLDPAYDIKILARKEESFLHHRPSFAAMDETNRAELCATAGIGAYFKEKLGNPDTTKYNRAVTAMTGYFTRHAEEAHKVKDLLGLKDSETPANIAVKTAERFREATPGQSVKLGEAMLGFKLPMTETLIAQERLAEAALNPAEKQKTHGPQSLPITAPPKTPTLSNPKSATMIKG